MAQSMQFNFAIDVVERLARDRPNDEGLRAISRGGERRSYSFAEVARRGVAAAAGLWRAGVRRGDVVMTQMGARPEWVFTLLGAWRLGATALPCSEQLRQADIALRIKEARPKVAVASSDHIEDVI